MNTPPLGNPVVNLVLRLDKKLDTHMADDTRRQESIQTTLSEQSLEMGRQTAMLSQLIEERRDRRQLDMKRAETNILLQSRVKGWFIKGIMGLALTGLGAYLHHML